jgi:hypothetical protein
MRRNSLLAASLLSVLLATTACGAVTGAPGSSVQSPNSAAAGIEASARPDKPADDQVGASQRAAAGKAAAEARKAADAEAEKAAAEAGRTARAEADAAAAAEKEAAALAAARAAAVVPAPAAAAPAVPAPAAALPAAPKPAPAPSASSSAAERVVTTTYTTAYTWHDNTPAGSAAISHPVLHQSAGGTGTYEDPITIAVGHSLASGEDVLDFPAGTRIYLPDVRRYFIVEDTCGDGDEPEGGPCHQGAKAQGTNSTIWIDMWIGGQSVNAAAADECASKVTDVNTAVFNPASNYAVAPGAGVIHDGRCDAGYGNTLVRQ